jgi:hypothetical protein
MANLIRELRAQLGTIPVTNPCAVLIVPWDHSSLWRAAIEQARTQPFSAKYMPAKGTAEELLLWTSVSN